MSGRWHNVDEENGEQVFTRKEKRAMVAFASLISSGVSWISQGISPEHGVQSAFFFFLCWFILMFIEYYRSLK